MEATTAASPPPTTRTGSTSDRILAILGALAGALAVSGSLLTWLTVEKHRRSVTVRGTSFGAGKLALIAGIVIVIAAAAWIVSSAPRLRLGSAVVVLAAGAAIAISIGAGLASSAFFDAPATPKHTHQHQKKSASPSASGSAVGAVFAPDPTAQSSSAQLSSAHLTSARVSSTGTGSNVVTFHALAGGAAKGKGKGGKGTTSTLGAGLFIALGGGILALIVGIWALLTGRSPGSSPAASVPAAAGGSASGGTPEAPAATQVVVATDPAPEPTGQIPVDPGNG